MGSLASHLEPGPSAEIVIEKKVLGLVVCRIEVRLLTLAITNFAKQIAQLPTSHARCLTSSMDVKMPSRGGTGRILRMCSERCLTQRDSVITGSLPPASPRPILKPSISCPQILVTIKERSLLQEKQNPSSFSSLVSFHCDPQMFALELTRCLLVASALCLPGSLEGGRCSFHASREQHSVQYLQP